MYLFFLISWHEFIISDEFMHWVLYFFLQREKIPGACMMVNKKRKHLFWNSKLHSRRWPSKWPPCRCRRCKRCEFDLWVGKIPWRSKWQPTLVFLPGESHGQRSLESYSPWDCKEPDMTARTRKACSGQFLSACHWSCMWHRKFLLERIMCVDPQGLLALVWPWCSRWFS